MDLDCSLFCVLSGIECRSIVCSSSCTLSGTESRSIVCSSLCTLSGIECRSIVWMASLFTLHTGILGHFMQKKHKKHVFFRFASRTFIVSTAETQN